MKNLLTNKFFILGNIALLLIAIPATLYFVKQQQDNRSKAAPSSKLYITPATTTTSNTCPSFTQDVMLDPGSNLVSIVTFTLTYDPTRVDVTQITPSDTFKTVQTPASITNGEASISLDALGGDVTKAVSTVSKVATVTFTPKTAGVANIQIDSAKSEVLALPPGDGPTDNVLSSTGGSTVTINTNACAGTSPGVTNTQLQPSTSPTIPPGQGGSPIPAGTGTGSASLSPTPIPTAIPTPTLIPTATPIPPTPTLAEKPTIAPTGSIATTVGISIAVILAVIAGFALLAL